MGFWNRSRHARGAGFPRPGRRVRHSLPALEWVQEASGRCIRVTAIGNRSLLVENHTGIQCFSGECIRLGSAGGELCIHGNGLTLRDVRADALIVRGDIQRLELPCEGRDAARER